MARQVKVDRQRLGKSTVHGGNLARCARAVIMPPTDRFVQGKKASTGAPCPMTRYPSGDYADAAASGHGSGASQDCFRQFCMLQDIFVIKRTEKC